jgi:tRNA A37 threonylcarbamoyladenosine synthetase subunit TsaC/SUA5/YrdC
MIVTAQTGFVGVRAPKHPIARKIIELSGLPIGAPSANLFSHVSPT